MGSIILVGITLGLTILAFIKQNGMLYAVNIILWLVSGFVLYNLTYPTGNTYLPYAAILVCFAMTIVMTVQTLNFYIYSRRTRTPTDEETQASYRRQVYKLTRKKKGMWD